MNNELMINKEVVMTDLPLEEVESPTTKKIVAAIGATKVNKVDPNRRADYIAALVEKARLGYALYIGGADGADMIALRIFVDIYKSMDVKVFLPWKGFNSRLLTPYMDSIDIEIYDPIRDVAATKSVNTYHPSSAALDERGRYQQARNYLIVYPADIVIALPELPYGAGPINNIPGGTFQGIRIAQDMDREVIIY